MNSWDPNEKVQQKGIPEEPKQALADCSQHNGRKEKGCNGRWSMYKRRR